MKFDFEDKSFEINGEKMISDIDFLLLKFEDGEWSLEYNEKHLLTNKKPYRKDTAFKDNASDIIPLLKIKEAFASVFR